MRPDHIEPFKSPISGFGIKTTKDLKLNEMIGLSHIQRGGVEDGYIRTFFGALINHAEGGNCYYQTCGEDFYLHAKREIKAGEELTIKYGKIKRLV